MRPRQQKPGQLSGIPNLYDIFLEDIYAAIAWTTPGSSGMGGGGSRSQNCANQIPLGDKLYELRLNIAAIQLQQLQHFIWSTALGYRLVRFSFIFQFTTKKQQPDNIISKSL